MKSNVKVTRKPKTRSLGLEDRRRFGAKSKTERYLLDTDHPHRSGRRKRTADHHRFGLKFTGDSNPSRKMNPLFTN